MENKFVLVNSKAAPEIFLKVLSVKQMLADGRYKKTGDAIAAANLSRSAYYKYKDYVFEYNRSGNEQMFTLFFELADYSGVLSAILNTLATSGFNVLTINQNIPINGYANVTITARYRGNDVSFEELMGNIRQLAGVNKVQLLAVQ